MGIVLTLVLSSCAIPGKSAEEANLANKPQVRITLLEAYQGVKDGNVESVQLPGDSAFVTVRLCVENLSAIPQPVYWQDVFLTGGNNAQTLPVALGFDQAEAFSWLLPIAAPVGAKRIDHKFYFFLIQKNELMSLPAYQSLGCDQSSQFKSMALLFILKKEMVDEPYTLHFLGAKLPLTPKRDFSRALYIIWSVGSGLSAIALWLTVVVLRKRKLKAQIAMNTQIHEDAAEDS